MDILEFAINMEIEGEKFYDDLAKKNKDNSISIVMQMLAKDEKEHANILRNRKLNMPEDQQKNNSTLTEAESIFKKAKSFKDIVKQTPDQLDTYRLALEKEQQSIDLYQRLLLKTPDDKVKQIFEFLINQEKEHYKIIEELVLMLKHAEDWVEDAEFGLRTEEY